MIARMSSARSSRVAASVGRFDSPVPRSSNRISRADALQSRPRRPWREVRQSSGCADLNALSKPGIRRARALRSTCFAPFSNEITNAKEELARAVGGFGPTEAQTRRPWLAWRSSRTESPRNWMTSRKLDLPDSLGPTRTLSGPSRTETRLRLLKLVTVSFESALMLTVRRRFFHGNPRRSSGHAHRAFTRPLRSLFRSAPRRSGRPPGERQSGLPPPAGHLAGERSKRGNEEDLTGLSPQPTPSRSGWSSDESAACRQFGESASRAA